ncbi:serine/threonine-protein kinase [Arthrobacter sp. Leaf137]|uniref:serine/threonine-protein kinase n=1 Tax=Arthrobacter sp. Leaf137 TaxID=1736271 RepID=UPI000701F219|nr:serine/threonine-protein kinase [Arthrobacter sp. Leaf137]KQQ81080.1 serine/threonine protein kinase [Arthrobacter sp. Leaf137]
MDDLQAPDVPGFAVDRLLGRGSSASVWLAAEQATGRKYAVKCFHPGSGESRCRGETSEEAVRREIRILSVLDHQHLVRAHDAVSLHPGPPGDAEGRAPTALIMDYASGGSLGQLLGSRGRLSVGETVTVLTPIAQALSYLHGKGFTHGDVSPGNVLFTGQGKPMLSDLGIARMLGDPAGGAGHGTPGFVDPAPVDAVRAGLQPERDVYAAAALGWFCLTGAAPPRTADRPPLPLLVPGVPVDLAAALEAGLSEDRRLRPTAGALATAVYRSAAPVPVDLSAAVHPTVIAELLTRRHVPPPSPGRLKERLGTLRRRVATPPRLTAVPAATGEPARRKDTGGAHVRSRKHAGGHRNGAHRSVTPTGVRQRRTVLAAGAAAGAAMVLWLTPLSQVALGTLDPAGDGRAAAEAASATAGDSAAVQAGGPAALDEARALAASAQPADALRGLAALRDHAFRSGQVDLLAEVNASGSPAAAADHLTAERLSASGRVLSGFISTLSDIRTEPGPTDSRAVVQATAATSAWEEKDTTGTVAAKGADAPGQPLRLVLIAEDGKWRISEILPGS